MWMQFFKGETYGDFEKIQISEVDKQIFFILRLFNEVMSRNLRKIDYFKTRAVSNYKLLK
jgi:hypothetical protein